MGGRGSGSWYRYSKKTYLDECRCLDINRMVKTAAIPEHGWRSGSWIWTDSETGEKKASIGYEANTAAQGGAYLRLHYTLTDRGEKVDYKIRLESTQPRYGGKRFWFICPSTGRRVTKLYLPFGGTYFASRHAYRLSYASQSEGAGDRAIRRKWKLQNKVGGYDFPHRPKGMHQKTFERLANAVCQAEEQIDGYIFQRFGGMG